MKLKDLSLEDKIVLAKGIVDAVESDESSQELSQAKAWFLFNLDLGEDIPLWKMASLYLHSFIFSEEAFGWTFEEYMKGKKDKLDVIPITEEMAMSLKDVYFDEFGCPANEFFYPVSETVGDEEHFHFGMKLREGRYLLIEKEWKDATFEGFITRKTPYSWGYWAFGYPAMYGHMIPPNDEEKEIEKGRMMLRKIDGESYDPNRVYTEEEKEMYGLKPGEYVVCSPLPKSDL